ncbi:MAG: hypothetical protein Fues2KO_25120 [Fuerstiella sp.]
MPMLRRGMAPDGNGPREPAVGRNKRSAVPATVHPIQRVDARRMPMLRKGMAPRQLAPGTRHPAPGTRHPAPGQKRF